MSRLDDIIMIDDSQEKKYQVYSRRDGKEPEDGSRFKMSVMAHSCLVRYTYLHPKLAVRRPPIIGPTHGPTFTQPQHSEPASHSNVSQRDAHQRP